MSNLKLWLSSLIILSACPLLLTGCANSEPVIDDAPANGLSIDAPASDQPKQIVDERSTDDADIKQPVNKYTAEQAAEHDSAADCWQIVDGTVYDMTRYIAENQTHPASIADWCGQDASRHFQDIPKHTDQSREALAEFKIGLIQ